MPTIARTARDMIANMAPVLRAGEFVFVTTPEHAFGAALLPQAMASFREDEGLSLILPLDVAKEAGFDVGQPMRCITLNVFSALDGVGLTAGVSGVLAEQGIPCNMVAAYHHDHVFVPSPMAQSAVEILKSLQERTAAG